MKKLATATLAAVLTLGSAWAHCQIPCGIYGDDIRLTLLKEHAATIEKSMKKIEELSRSILSREPNQLVRWVTNKDLHATKVQDMVQQYFLAQRIKFPEKESDRRAYLQKLEFLHQIIVYAMKCKQTTDLGNVEKLRTAIHDFAHAYTGK